MSGYTVLFVDDEEDALVSFKAAMEDRGYSILTASTGAAALEILKTTRPDAIVADIRMTPMNGFVFFQEAKKLFGGLKIPFIFLSAIDDPVSQKYGKSLGVDSYITKPINPDHIDLILKRKLNPS
jgi:two-component system, OmpR family, response regulator